jgi:hypothetical protein
MEQWRNGTKAQRLSGSAIKKLNKNQKSNYLFLSYIFLNPFCLCAIEPLRHCALTWFFTLICII